jgi:hypothetical protein
MQTDFPCLSGKWLIGGYCRGASDALAQIFCKVVIEQIHHLYARF